ncbi:MAG: calcium/sodium antiporter [Anaerolineae bacterium]|nr:calcium/sodium antiporter [Anaerolineae bacterium]
MMLNFLMITLGIAGLFFGGEWLVTGASRLARSLGLSPLIVGLTIVAFGTSVPELLVSLNAVFQSASDISVGNIVGSNIANIGLILGLTGIVFPIVIHVRLVWREIPIMVAVSILAYLLARDGILSTGDGLLLLLSFAGFNYLMYRITMQERRSGKLTEADLMEGEEPDNGTAVNRPLEVGRLMVGIVLLMIGARLTVDGAVAIARILEISELFIGLTVVAIGTSLPELATSIVAALRKESDIAVGNVVGSNIFNLLLILGVTSTLHPLPVSAEVVNFDLPLMVGFALILFPFARNQEVSRWESVVLLTGYVIFTLAAFLR